MFRLDGKVAVVTGAGSGIGQAIALLFARQGATVLALDLAAGGAAATAEQARAEGGRAEDLAADVSDGSQVRAALAEAEARHGRVDVLVNNAGVAHVGTVETTAEADFERIFRVNVKGVYLCTQAAVPIMLRQG